MVYQNVQNFKPNNIYFITFFDIMHGLATKCKKPGDEAKTFQINFLDDEISLLTLNFAFVFTSFTFSHIIQLKLKTN